MSGTISICEITDEVKKELEKFRFSSSPTTNAIILKIDRDSHRLVLDGKYEDCEIEEIGRELPSQQPRFIIISYHLEHSDGRSSYPMCLIYYSPSGCSPEMQMLYAGSRNRLVEECELTKNLEIRDAEELTKETLSSNLRW
ncbi:hypothetical protein AB6A40_007287 [Gnathostoma spinigerum]|uniref:ADF-H domain-containing protein n=1 Tax=Gnathostoma spinigerum TaxID=75299 RepID=A0ABD6EU57_9BILA